MYYLEIEHADMEGPDGQTCEHPIAQFTTEVEALKASNHLNILFRTADKIFSVHEATDYPINPSIKQLEEEVSSFLKKAKPNEQDRDTSDNKSFLSIFDEN